MVTFPYDVSNKKNLLRSY